VKTILGSLTSQTTRTTEALLGTSYLRTATESILRSILFLSEEFSHSLGHNRTHRWTVIDRIDWNGQRSGGLLI
jgi:hypothetical protein